jgi:hypothetical protein
LIYGRETHARVSHRLDITALGAAGKEGKEGWRMPSEIPVSFFPIFPFFLLRLKATDKYLA